MQVLFALHSDFTMAPAQPLLQMWVAVNRQTVMGEEKFFKYVKKNFLEYL